MQQESDREMGFHEKPSEPGFFDLLDQFTTTVEKQKLNRHESDSEDDS